MYVYIFEKENNFASFEIEENRPLKIYKSNGLVSQTRTPRKTPLSFPIYFSLNFQTPPPHLPFPDFYFCFQFGF